MRYYDLSFSFRIAFLTIQIRRSHPQRRQSQTWMLYMRRCSSAVQRLTPIASILKSCRKSGKRNLIKLISSGLFLEPVRFAPVVFTLFFCPLVSTFFFCSWFFTRWFFVVMGWLINHWFFLLFLPSGFFSARTYMSSHITERFYFLIDKSNYIFLTYLYYIMTYLFTTPEPSININLD